MTQVVAPERAGWLRRLRAGLSRSSTRLSDGIADILSRQRLDARAIEEIEELLITADLGPAPAARVAARLADTRFEGEVSAEGVRRALAEQIAEILEPIAVPLTLPADRRPQVILVIGVNGTGKTTTIGKLAHDFRAEGKRVMLCAGDTFRAAAIDQLKIWGQRAGAPVIAREPGANAAGLVYDALEQATAAGADVLLIDTAGRLHTKSNLMAELGKIDRVLKKLDPEAPHSCLLVIDATTGQNAHAQVEMFRESIPVTGLVVTKLDGTAKGGVLVALAERFGLPVHAIGVGEGVADLRPFSAPEFARGLLGLDT